MSGVPSSADVFRAVADPTRRRLLDLLAESDRSVTELAQPFRMTQPAISQHLRILRKAGLVSARRAGPRRVYRINPRPLARVRQWAERHAQVSDPAGHAWRLIGPRPSPHLPRGGTTHSMLTTTMVKRFESPDEVRTFQKGRLELIKIGTMTLGLGTYEPGWRWSEHIKPIAGTESCQIQHIGTVISGRCAFAMDDGTQVELKRGDVFYVAPGHDSWVVGDEPLVALHFVGADAFAK
jgi:DNA-binding transcriptional ArsR family regulator